MKNLAHYTLETFFKAAINDPSLKAKKFSPLLASYNKAYDVLRGWIPENLKDVNSFTPANRTTVVESLMMVFKFSFPTQISGLFLKNIHVLISANFFADGNFKLTCPLTSEPIDCKELLIRIPETYINKSMTHLTHYLELIKVIQALMENDLLCVHDRGFLTLFSNLFTILRHYAIKHNPNEAVANAAILQIIGVLMHRVEGKKYRFRSEVASVKSSELDDNSNSGDLKSLTGGGRNGGLNEQQPQSQTKNDFILSNDKFEMTKISPKYEHVLDPYQEEFKQQNSTIPKDEHDNSESAGNSNDGDSSESAVASSGEERPASNTPAAIKGSPSSQPLEPTLARGEAENAVFDDPYIKDAYNLLILLDRTVAGYYNDVSKGIYNTSQSFRMLLASLSYIRHVIRLCGPRCSNHSLFVQYCKEEIYLLLMKVISLTHSNVFSLCLRIFSSIITKFRKYVKHQIEIYFNNVVISLIRSNTMLPNKALILESLIELLKNMDIIGYLYVNFDCDKRCYNVFETLVDALSKQAKQIDDDIKPRDIHVACCSMALECLVIIFWQLNLSAEKYWKTHRQSPVVIDNSSKANLKLNDDPQRVAELSVPHSATVSPSSSNAALNASQSILMAKEKKSILDNGIDLFNESPNRGLRFLKSSGVISDNPLEVAKFLLETHKLSRVQIGNYLGESDEEALQTMYAYVDLFDFKGKNLLDCLRLLLSNFWLPGEAQKIDRIMEKFAGHYFIQNPNQNLFSSADVAYILSYSIIMLTTDLHNQHIKNKITLDQYIFMNSKVNNGEDLPVEFLTGIYNSIKEKPIDLKASFDKKIIRNDFKMSTISESTIKQLEESISRSDESHSIVDIPHEAIVGTIFQTIWKQCLVSFSVAINKITDTNLLYVPISGVRIAIRVSALLGDDLALDAYLKSLINFTNLTTGSILSEMKNKHIDALRAVLTVANEDGNYINDNWFDILKVISNLELVQYYANKAGNYTVQDTDNIRQKKQARKQQINANQGITLKSISSSISSYVGDSNNCTFVSDTIHETISQSILISVDRIFSNTKNLDDDSIVIFVKNLCRVSIDEINEPTNSRTFMLNKIVEIAHYNMDRIRISWSKIWRILRKYFNLVGCVRNEDIASFCIVSLRQLALKFLEKEELENFHFQKEFLKPFEYIFSNNPSRTIKELILKSVDQIIQVQFARIRSGWTRLLSVLAQAAQEPDIEVVRKAFLITSGIIKRVSDLVNINIRDTIICTLVVFATPATPPTKRRPPHSEKVQIVDGTTKDEHVSSPPKNKGNNSDVLTSTKLNENFSFNSEVEELGRSPGELRTTTTGENEPTQRDKIKLAFSNACSFETQVHPIKSEFTCDSPRSSIVRASFSRNHSIDDPSTLLRQYSSESTAASSRRMSVVELTNALGVTENYFYGEREKIAHEVFITVKLYVDQILAKMSDFNHPPEYQKNPWVTSWIVLLNRLAFLVQNGRDNIGNLALRTLNSILHDYSHLFTQDLWQDIINIYLNIFTICKCSNRDLSNQKKLEWLNKVSQCAFEGLTGIVLSQTPLFNKGTIVTFFDFLCYWIRDVELEILSISSFICVRILLKELLGKIQMSTYVELFTSYMDAAIITFPHNFVPYCSESLTQPCKLYCDQFGLDYVQSLHMDQLEKFPNALHSQNAVETFSFENQNEGFTTESNSSILDYSSFNNDTLVSHFPAVWKEKLSLKNVKIRRIYNEINKCQIQVEYMLSLTSILSFFQDTDDNIKNEFFNSLDEITIRKWVSSIHSIYSCLKFFNNDQSLRETVFKNIVSTSCVLREMYTTTSTSDNKHLQPIPGVHIQQSTAAGCLLKYIQAILFYGLTAKASPPQEHHGPTFDYIVSVYREIISDFCNAETNLDLWNSTLTIELAHLLHLSSQQHTNLFNKIVSLLYENLCSLISSNIDQTNKQLLSQLFLIFTSRITQALTTDVD